MPLKYLMFFLFFSNTSFAQNTSIGNWVSYFGNQKIKKDYNWHNELQYRNYNFVGDLQQILLRTGIGYNLTENNNNILMGYAFIYTEKYLPIGGKQSLKEHRIYQQYLTKQNFGRVALQHRYRIEERFFTNDFQIRLRYLLGFNIALNNKKVLPKTWYAALTNEVMLNTKKSLFDRNRLFAGLGYMLNNNFKAEIGFMAQTLEKENRNQFIISFFNNTPFAKKK